MTYYFSLGSNLGNREQTLDQAVGMMEERIGRVCARSSFYYSEPWGFESTHPFCNICLSVISPIQPLEMLHETQSIERELGRLQKSEKGLYHDRTIDIDLLQCFDEDNKDIIIQTKELTLPHPLMQQRDFVMIPLQEITDKKKG